MDLTDLPPEVQLAEECSAALERGDVEAARQSAERGLQLATANRSPTWTTRFQNLLNMCAPHTPEASVGETIQCSFCQAQSSAARQVVAGPRVFICNSCVHDCVGGRSDGAEVQRLYIAGVACSFCSRTVDDRAPVYGARGNYICPECVGVCVDIFADSRVQK